ncbi:hypothetical protein GCM10027037_31680 [Mucilaginibacter koreensis]
MEQVSTASKIISSAINILNQDYSASLETIAAEAGVTRRTLHRYFTDRNHLLESCMKEIQQACRQQMLGVLNNNDAPLMQLKKMLYAGIDCGSKYTFLHKIHQHPGHQHAHENSDCRQYDELNERFFKLIHSLKKDGHINTELTTGWILALFTGVISATVNATVTGAVAVNDRKDFAWFSFSKGIGC